MVKVKQALRKNTMLIALIGVMALFQVLIMAMDKGSLLDPQNISNLILQNSYVVILATGMLLCILTGGNIDLSVGSIVAFVGAIAGDLIINKNVNIYLTILVCLIVGILIGVWQGFWIAYARIPAFIVTLAGMLIWRGLANVVLQGLTLAPFPDDFLMYFSSYLPGDIAPELSLPITLIVGGVCSAIMIVATLLGRARKRRKGYKLDSLAGMIARLVIITVVIMAASFQLGRHKGIPVVLILLLVIVLAYTYFTTRTVPGRHLYALGGNEKATKLSGINTNRVMFFAYVNMAFLSAVAALVCVARFNSAAPSAGNSYELDAIGSCFIGGASAYGGTGTVGGAVIGAIFMGVLNNGMSILGVDSNWQRVVKGLVLLLAVVFDVLSKKRAKAE